MALAYHQLSVICLTTRSKWTFNIHDLVFSQETKYDFCFLTHWGRVTHICVSKLTIIGSDNGLSPDRRQAIIWTNAGILFIGPLGTNFSEILIEILTFSFKKMCLKVSSVKWRPFCLGLNVLKRIVRVVQTWVTSGLLVLSSVRLLNTFKQNFVKNSKYFIEKIHFK